MFDSVLVADRGVVALRVVRSCQRLDVKAVTVHAPDDAGSATAAAADESVLLGGVEQYADALAVLEAARRTGCDAVHPGDGPLAGSPAFARAVAGAGLAWLGAPPEALERSPAELAAASGLELASARPAADRTRVLVADGQVLGAVRGGRLVPDGHAEALAVAGSVEGLLEVELAGSALAAVRPGLPAWTALVELLGGSDLVACRLTGQAPVPATGEGRVVEVLAADGAAGRLERFQLPQGDGVRVDAALAEGDELRAGDPRLLAVVALSGDGPLPEVDLAGVALAVPSGA